jgi:2-methylcitrate dehydratase PrpD
MAAGQNFGTMTKPFHADGRHPRTASGGAARRGMTAAADVLEHPRGFLSAISPAGRVRRDEELSAGRDWHILRHGLSIRRYPMCYSTNRTIDATLDLAAKHRFAPEQVESVEVTMGRAQYIPLLSASPNFPGPCSHQLRGGLSSPDAITPRA